VTDQEGLLLQRSGRFLRGSTGSVTLGGHGGSLSGMVGGQIAIGAWIGRQPGATEPEEIAPLYWELHTHHDQVEKVFSPASNQLLSTRRTPSTGRSAPAA
jgi:hypothetical protein